VLQSTSPGMLHLLDKLPLSVRNICFFEYNILRLAQLVIFGTSTRLGLRDINEGLDAWTLVVDDLIYLFFFYLFIYFLRLVSSLRSRGLAAFYAVWSV